MYTLGQVQQIANPIKNRFFYEQRKRLMRFSQRAWHLAMIQTSTLGEGEAAAAEAQQQDL